jgi:hypothetical protein
MKWYRNPVQMLFGNTVGLLLLLAYTSFLNYASVLTLVGIFVTSVLWAGIAKRKQFIHGMLPALISTSFLQFGYFYSGKDFIPSSISVPLFVLNLGIVVIVSFAGSWLGKTIGNKIRGIQEGEENKQVKLRSQFSENLKRLAVLTLVFYIQTFILVPFASKVFASEKQTTDQFIERYDPDKQYKVAPERLYEPPKERMPKEGAGNVGTTTPYAYLTEEQIKEIETKCKISGCNTQEELEKANNLQKNNLEEEANIQELELTNPEKAKMEKFKKQNLTMDQILKLQKEGKIDSKEAFALVANGIQTGNISAWEAFWKKRKALKEFVKNNPEAQKIVADLFKNPIDVKNQYRLLALADKYIGGPFHGAKEFVDAAIVEPGTALVKFVKKHPKEAIISGVIGVGATIVCVAVPPVGIAVSGVGIVFTSASLIGAYVHGGKSELAHNVFSKKTINMYLSGDIWGAVGRGSVELGGLIISNTPESPGTYIQAAGFISTVVRFKRGATILSDIRDGIAVARQAGKVSAETIKVGSELIKLGLKNGDEATKVLGTYLFSNNNLALLGTISKNVDDAGRIGGLEARQAALKKEFDGLMKMVSPQNNPPTRIPLGHLDVDVPSWSNEAQFKHSMGGEIKGKDLKGLHHVPSNSNITHISIQPHYRSNSLGFYEADVEVVVNGVKYRKIKTTMWPDSWSQQKIAEEVEYAFKNKVPDSQTNGEIGKTKDGISVLFFNRSNQGYNFYPILGR